MFLNQNSPHHRDIDGVGKDHDILGEVVQYVEYHEDLLWEIFVRECEGAYFLGPPTYDLEESGLQYAKI